MLEEYGRTPERLVPFARLDPKLEAITLRCARFAGLAPEAIETVAGGQLNRLLAGEAALDLGPRSRPVQRRAHPRGGSRHDGADRRTELSAVLGPPD